MSSIHFTRDHVGVVHPSPDSFTPDPNKVKALGITLVYLPMSASLAQFNAYRAAYPRVGVFCAASTTGSSASVASAINDARLKLCAGDQGQTPFLLDFEPSDGAFWKTFIPAYRNLMPGRVTDFTPEPFKAQYLPAQDLLDARFDVKVQTYFGDMSPVDAWEAGAEWLNAGFPQEAIRMMVDGGRKNPPPIFYNGKVVRPMLPGSCVWSMNLLREAGLV